LRRRRACTAVVAVAVSAALWGAAARARAADAARPGAADSPTVAARVAPAEGLVGDRLTLTITAVGPRSTPVNLPTNVPLGPFSLLDRQDEEKDLGDGRMSRTFTLFIAAYEPGALEVPAIDVTYLGSDGHVLSARTTPVAVTIKSLLANEPEPALKENAPPVTVLEEDLLLLYIAGGLLAAALGALLSLWVRRRLRARASVRPAPPPRPAHELALERLDQLAAQGFTPDADYRPFYFAVSEIVREYLGARFGFESLELTTEELLFELRKRAARAVIMGEVAGWLTACDLVKFAKISPSAEEARGTFETAVRIVEGTRPRPDPQAHPETLPTDKERARA
jgi:hypothetical protein